MKICTITNPTSIHSYRWIKFFVERGHEIHLIHFECTYKPKGKIDMGLKNVTIHKVKYFTDHFRVLQLPFELIQLFRIMKKIKPDILDAKYVTHRGWYGALLNFHPYFLNVWGGDIDLDPEISIRARFRVKYALKKADFIRISSKVPLRKILALGGTEKKIIVHPSLGVETKKFSPKTRSKELRERFSPLNSPLIICIRALKPDYYLETYLRAIPEILKIFPDAKFIHAGKGILEDSLKKLARELGIEDSIFFIGHISHDEVPAYLASSDVYVDPFVPYNIGGGTPGLGSREAWSCGVATVHAGPNPLMALVIKDGYNGLFFKANDPKDLAEKIIFLIKNKKLRKLFGKRSRAKMKEMFEFSKTMSTLEKKYLSIVKEFKKNK